VSKGEEVSDSQVSLNLIEGKRLKLLTFVDSDRVKLLKIASKLTKK
jgi:hypothetical protein